MLFAILLALLIMLLLFGGVPGLVLAGIWVAGGVYFVTNSRSRGLYADATFFLSWPIHLIAGE